LDSAVITIGRLRGNGIQHHPDEAKFWDGAFPESKVREELKSRMEQVTQGVAKSFGVDSTSIFNTDTPRW